MSPRSVPWVVAMSSVLFLTGCQSSPEALYYDGVAEQRSADAYSSDSMATEQMAGAEMASPDMSTGSFEPDVITTGYLTMSVETPASTADEITELVSEAGGRVSSRSDYTPVDFGQPSSYLEVRIPSDDLDDTVSAITDLGDVQEISVNTLDVSLQKVDLDARIRVLDSAISRLEELLQSASSTADLVTIESALTERQSERDSLQSQRDYLSDQTLFATLSINLITPEDAIPSDPDGFFDGLERGWLGILSFFAGVIVWAGILVPWVALGAVVIALLWLIRRAVASRRAK
jgi:hypothetical protein